MCRQHATELNLREEEFDRRARQNSSPLRSRIRCIKAETHAIWQLCAGLRVFCAGLAVAPLTASRAPRTCVAGALPAVWQRDDVCRSQRTSFQHSLVLHARGAASSDHYGLLGLQRQADAQVLGMGQGFRTKA